MRGSEERITFKTENQLERSNQILDKGVTLQSVNQNYLGSNQEQHVRGGRWEWASDPIVTR